MESPGRVSQSELTAKKVFDQYFGGIRHLDNYKPEWLQGMELDRYYPTMGFAIEFQGDQHSRVVPIIHEGPVGLQRQLSLDTKKRHICEQKGVRLYAINLLDLDRFRVVNFFKKLAKEGSYYANQHGHKDDSYRISRIRFVEPDSGLMRKVDRLSHVRKSYYHDKKKSWWKKFLRI